MVILANRAFGVAGDTIAFPVFTGMLAGRGVKLLPGRSKDAVGLRVLRHVRCVNKPGRNASARSSLFCRVDFDPSGRLGLRLLAGK